MPRPEAGHMLTCDQMVMYLRPSWRRRHDDRLAYRSDNVVDRRRVEERA
jgi:hypothetical protein